MEALLEDPTEWAGLLEAHHTKFGVAWERAKLWQAYESWCVDEGERADKKKFFERMRDSLGYQEIKIRGAIYFRNTKPQ